MANVSGLFPDPLAQALEQFAEGKYVMSVPIVLTVDNKSVPLLMTRSCTVVSENMGANGRFYAEATAETPGFDHGTMVRIHWDKRSGFRIEPARR